MVTNSGMLVAISILQQHHNNVTNITALTNSEGVASSRSDNLTLVWPQKFFHDLGRPVIVIDGQINLNSDWSRQSISSLTVGLQSSIIKVWLTDRSICGSSGHFSSFLTEINRKTTKWWISWLSAVNSEQLTNFPNVLEQKFLRIRFCSFYLKVFFAERF